MEFVADVEVIPSEPLHDMAARVSTALGFTLEVDRSGNYEEYPALVATLLGIEVALLGIPESRDKAVDSVASYYLLVKTYSDAVDYDVVVDIGAHLEKLLVAEGIECKAYPSEE